MGKSKSGGFSLRTKDAVDGGGTEGALATVKEIGFVEGFTYGGRHKDKPNIALNVVYDIEGFKEPWDQNYSVGPEDRYELVNDGDGVRSNGGSKGLNRKSAAYAFFEALEAAAETSDVDLDELLPDIDGEDVQSIRPLEGRQVRLKNVKFETVSGDTKDLVVIGALVDDEPAKGNGRSTGRNTSSGSSRTNKFDVEAATEEAITALIKEHTSVKSGDVANLIFAANKKDPNVKALMQQSFRKSWLTSDDRPWTVDKKGVIRASD